MVNTTAAIMALPAPLDPVRLIGDEDKHATLLYFGETSSLPDDARSVLTDAVQTAAKMLWPFRESIRDIVRLGTDNPPALVAMLSDQNLSQIRNLFMMNPSVKGYLDNTTQFASFTPHVTLGYPDYTEEVVLKTLARQIYNISFDRLVVWWNDERLEFNLDFEPSDTLAMSDAVQNFLEHSEDIVTEIVAGKADAQQHGVRGQKWGVRKNLVGAASLGSVRGGQSTFAPEGEKAPTRGEAKTIHQTTQKIRLELLNSKTGVVSPNGVITQLNKKWASKFPLNDHDSNTYDRSAELLMSAHAQRFAPKGTKTRVAIDGPNNTMTLLVGDKQAVNDLHKALSHDDVNQVKFSIRRDSNGAIADIQSLDMAHSNEAVEEFLEHHGIKGQKWGVRRSKDTSTGLVSGSSKSTLKRAMSKDTPDGSGVKTGLKPRTSSADKIAQDRIASKLKSNGTKSLSNKDIQDFTRRLQLEKDLNSTLASLSAAEKAKADGFIKTFVKNQSSRQLDRVANKAIDVAIEAALKQAGTKIGESNPELGSGIKEVAGRLKPKKGK